MPGSNQQGWQGRRPPGGRNRPHRLRRPHWRPFTWVIIAFNLPHPAAVADLRCGSRQQRRRTLRDETGRPRGRVQGRKRRGHRSRRRDARLPVDGRSRHPGRAVARDEPSGEKPTQHRRQGWQHMRRRRLRARVQERLHRRLGASDTRSPQAPPRGPSSGVRASATAEPVMCRHACVHCGRRRDQSLPDALHRHRGGLPVRVRAASPVAVGRRAGSPASSRLTPSSPCGRGYGRGPSFSSAGPAALLAGGAGQVRCTEARGRREGS